MGPAENVVSQAKRFLRQEAAWDSEVYMGGARRGGGAEGRGSRGAEEQRGAGAGEKTSALQALNDAYKDCVRCPLGPTRIKFVFGVGNPESKVMFIGEGPGYQEDRQGEPFVGKAGQLLDKMMAAIGLSRQTNAYIANIVKCHPMTDPSTPDARGNDRPPTPEEVDTCSPILLRQIAVIQPAVIVTLGSPSSKMILRTAEAITKIRGKLFPFPVDAFYPEALPADAEADAAPPVLSAGARETLRRTQVLPTFHPAALLRNPNLKADSWADLKLLRDTFLKERSA